MRRSALCVIILSAILHAEPSPRPGWVYVPGAENLIQSGQWGCASGVQLGANSLTVSAGASGYNTVINTSGPILSAAGDFSVLATLSTAPGSTVYLTLVGALNTGSNWWDGLKRLDVGLSSGALQAGYWTGASSNETAQNFPLPAGSTSSIDLEVARIGAQIVIFIDGSPVGEIADPGLFAAGQVYFGFNVAPQNSLNVLALAAAMPSGSSDSLVAPYLTKAARTGTALRDSAEKTGFLIGAAVDPSKFASDSGYAQALGREFNFAVPENAMKFAETEPAPHQFSFCAGDQIVQYAAANGMKVRGHNLVWQQDLPSWLTSGNYSSADAAAILQEHIATVVGHYKAQLAEWDVVNEAIAYGAPYGPQPSYWLTQLGSGYIDQAFLWAHAADPNVKLFYNDTGGEGLGAKSDAVYNLVKGMVSRGIPINGVGLQMHVDTTSAPSASDISANMARLAALGLEVHITEMDVRVPVDANGNATAASLAAQATVYQSVVTACRANSNCTALLTWGVTDAYSWIPGSYPGFGDALLLDTHYNPKPAYVSAKAALDAATNTALPQIATGGIVIHGGAFTSVSPGSLVDIYGNNLAPAPATAPGVPLPTALGGVAVTVNSSAAPLYYVSNEQAIFQIPYETAPGPALIQVKTPAGSGASASITIQQAAPSILTYGGNWAVAQNQDASVNSGSNCAAPGSYLTVYLIGSGPLDNPIPTGAAAPIAPLSRETLATNATIGGVNAPLAFAGMTPGFIGLTQINVQVPNVPGNLPLQVQIGGFTSNQANVCVQGRL